MNKKVKKGLIGVLIIILLVGSGFGGYFLYRKFHPKIIKPFPDPFVFNNGTRVDTVGDWVSRRNEIKEIKYVNAYYYSL